MTSDASPKTIVRVVKRENPYVSIERATVQDTRLSWAARGMLAYLLSLPPDWKIKVEHLQCKGDAGRDAVRHILGELQGCGYVSGFGLRERCARGRLNTSAEIVVYESPNLNHHHKTEPSPATGKPSPVRPATASPATAKASPYKRKNSQKKQETKEIHTPCARVRASAAPPPAVAGVGVDKKTHHSLEVRKDYAARNHLGGGWLTNSKDGRYDDAIDAELERLSPEAVEAARSEPPDNNMKIGEARAHVRSVLAVGAHTNVSELLASLKVSDADRERLRAEFVEPAASRAQSAV